MSNNKYKILIVEDDGSIRTFVTALLESNGFQVVTASTASAGLLSFCSHRPDLVVLDLGLPDMDGMQILKAVRQWSKVPIVVVSARSHERDKVAALDAGAYGALSKDISNADLVQSLHDVLAGRHVLSPDIQNLIAANLESSALTARQVEILEMLARGLSNHDIATALRLSENGVKFHLRGLFAKLGAATRTEAVAVALRRRLL